MATKVKCYHLEWEKISWQDFERNLDKYTTESDKGIYQIYGTHSVYGQDSLLYIGKTDQSFGKRYAQHWDFCLNHFNEFSYVCLGRLYKTDGVTPENFAEIIGDIEGLLINSHYPAFNSQGIKYLYKPKSGHFIVNNWGNYFRLLPEVSTLRYSDEFWDDSMKLLFPKKEA